MKKIGVFSLTYFLLIGHLFAGATFSRVTTWTSGQTLTASALNGEFNNILTNLTPAGMDDYSATVTQMRTTSDPYPSGSESLATSLQGELERLRYQILQLKLAIQPDNVTYWYQDAPTAGVFSIVGSSVGINNTSPIGPLQVKQSSNINFLVSSGTLVSGAIGLKSINDAGTSTKPMELVASSVTVNANVLAVSTNVANITATHISTIYTTGDLTIGAHGNLPPEDSGGIHMGMPQDKATNASGGYGSIKIFSNDAFVGGLEHYLQGTIALGTSSTPEERRLQINCIEQNTDYRTVSLQEAGGKVSIGTAHPLVQLHIVSTGATTSAIEMVRLDGQSPANGFERSIGFYGDTTELGRISAYLTGTTRELRFWSGGTKGLTVRETGDVYLHNGVNVANVLSVDGGISTSSNVVVSRAIIVGSATGGDKGVGTINVSADIYKNNTAYTNPDYALEHWANGKIVKFINKPGASDYNGRLSLPDLETYIRKHYQLPRVGDKRGLFDRSDILLEKIEELSTYIIELNHRIDGLENKLKIRNKK